MGHGESLKASLAHPRHLRRAGCAHVDSSSSTRLSFCRFLSLPLFCVCFFSLGKMRDYITDPLNSIRLHLNVSVGSLQCPLRPHWGTPDPVRSVLLNARKFSLPQTFPEHQFYKRRWSGASDGFHFDSFNTLLLKVSDP